MADFNKAYDLLKKWEGGYSNDTVDKGGETIFGISRKNFPDIKIWEKIDELKKNGYNKNQIESYLKTDSNMQIIVKAFYLNNFWNILKCREIQNQAFAENIFLLAVNAGIKRAVKIAQEACSITVDGVYGKESAKAFLSAGEKEVIKFTEIEIEFYKSLVTKDKTQEKFLKGWLNRARAV